MDENESFLCIFFAESLYFVIFFVLLQAKCAYFGAQQEQV